MAAVVLDTFAPTRSDHTLVQASETHIEGRGGEEEKGREKGEVVRGGRRR